MSEIEALWATCKCHVECTLAQADNPEQMLGFVDAMCEYFKTLNYSQEVIKILRIRMGMITCHYVLELRSRQDKVLNECKRVIYDPDKEDCIIVPKKDSPRVEHMIRLRNNALPDHPNRKPYKGKIQYRVLN